MKRPFLGRGSALDYKFDDGSYLEDGRSKGADIGARYYPAGGMKGFFIGGSLGYWTSDWSFTHDKGTSSEYTGRGDTHSIRANVDIGGRFPLGASSVSVIPALNVGRFFPSTTCEYTAPASRVGKPCDQKSEVTNYLFLSLMAGIAF
jgi:outer membrane autotransporter protein